MKTIGVLGGFGPQATMDFEARFHRIAQRLIPQKDNSGFPGLIVRYCRFIPVQLGNDRKPLLPMRPDPRLLGAARQLGPMVDFLVITANAPYVFRDQVERASGREVLSMIDLTLAEVVRRNWKKIGVLGMGDPIVYTRPMREQGLACETLDPAGIDALRDAIYTLLEGREDEASRDVARRSVAELRGRNVDGTILGCTEIPLLMGSDAEAPDLIDPLELLADAAVRRGME